MYKSPWSVPIIVSRTTINTSAKFHCVKLFTKIPITDKIISVYLKKERL